MNRHKFRAKNVDYYLQIHIFEGSGIPFFRYFFRHELILTQETDYNRKLEHNKFVS